MSEDPQMHPDGRPTSQSAASVLLSRYDAVNGRRRCVVIHLNAPETTAHSLAIPLVYNSTLKESPQPYCTTWMLFFF